MAISLKVKKFLLKLLYASFFFVITVVWASKNLSYAFTSFDNYLIAFGKLFGLLAAYSVMVQLMLMGRVKWIERVFGHDKLTRMHRKNGYFVITYMLLHFSHIVSGYALASSVSIINQVQHFFFINPDLQKAIIALSLFIIIVFLSITILVTRLKYETWYYVHLFTYLAILLAFGHQLEFGSDFAGDSVFTNFWYGLYIFVAVNFLFFRFVRPLYISFTHQFEVNEIKQESDTVWSVYITGKDLDKLTVLPGQFIIVRFLTWKLGFEAHPFTISNYFNGQVLRLSIKAVGDFTSLISSIAPGTKLIIDGPHGKFTSEDTSKNKYLLIAGGIGITPLRSLAEELARRGKDVALVYSNKTKSEVIFDQEFTKLTKAYPNFTVQYNYTEEGEKKRVSAEVLKTQIADLGKREIYICGPIAMIKGLAADLVKLGIAKDQIHYEIFSF